MVFVCGIQLLPVFVGLKGFVQGSDIMKEAGVED